MEDQGTDKSAVAQIDRAVQQFLTELAEQKVKLNVSDVARLMDLRNDFAQDEVREVKVTWVESDPAPFVINT